MLALGRNEDTPIDEPLSAAIQSNPIIAAAEQEILRLQKEIKKLQELIVRTKRSDTQ